MKGSLTVVRVRDEPQAAVVLGGVFQSDPQTHDSAQRLRVQEGSVLMWRHFKNTVQIKSDLKDLL